MPFAPAPVPADATPREAAAYIHALNRGRMVHDFWLARGHDVSVELVREPHLRGVPHRGWSVRTDLVNGLPRRGTPRVP